MTYDQSEGIEYRKNATVLARRATASGDIETPEGVMHYETGDYIVGPGVGGEYWPVKRLIFEESYSVVKRPSLASKLAGGEMSREQRTDLAYETRRRREVKLVPHDYLISMATRFDDSQDFSTMGRAEVEEAVVQGELRTRR